MDIAEWLAATLLISMSSFSFVQSFRFRNATDRFISFLVLFVTQVCFGIFISGVCFQSLLNSTFLMVTLAVYLISVSIVYIRTGRVFPERCSQGIPRFRMNGISTAYTAMLILCLALVAYVGHLLPPYAYDELGYHLVSVASWIHDGRIQDTTSSLWANVYPKNAELVFAWLYLSVHSDSWVHLGQWIFALIGIAATVGITRIIGLKRDYAIIAGTLFFTVPTVVLQATTDYNDLAFTSMFLGFFYYYLKFIREADARYISLCGVTGGLALGIKSSASMYIGICFIVVVIMWIRWYRKRQIAITHIVMQACLFVVPILVLGTYWYIHTWAVYQNPVYPFNVEFHGHTIFHGDGSLQKLIITPNTPTQLLGKAWWEQVWISWTHIATYYAYDMQIGGFGIQWTFIELPALVMFAIYTLCRKKWMFFQLILPLLVIFILQPANWWARYTLFMPALGAWSVVYVLFLIRKVWIRTTLSTLLLVIVSGSYLAGGILFAATNKEDSSLVTRAITTAIHTPRAGRTVGSVVYR
ncbi:hypothetical protein AAC03nite_37610 [Alicyclobacillus acidoterrestris]|nr:hypothetical protein AAC03nite_37610 [Alicyclobacillus acidoterrestris]